MGAALFVFVREVWRQLLATLPDLQDNLLADELAAVHEEALDVEKHARVSGCSDVEIVESQHVHEYGSSGGGAAPAEVAAEPATSCDDDEETEWDGRHPPSPGCAL
jgi:hypothetical protein